MNNWIELEEKHGTGVYGNWPVALDKGKGSFVWDTNGKRYLDFGAGLGVVGIGHANDTIADAISRQSLKLTHAVNGYYASPVRANFLSKLSAITPNDGLFVTFQLNDTPLIFIILSIGLSIT